MIGGVGVSGPALALRAGVAIVVVFMALNKIADRRRLAYAIWRPAGMSATVTARMLIGLIGLEVAFGVTLLFCLLGTVPTALVTGVFFASVTGFGVTSIRRRGTCGCGGLNVTEQGVSALMRRNCVLLSCAELGIVLGPSSHALAHRHVYGTVVAVLPIAAAIAVGLWRYWQQRRRARAPLAVMRGSVDNPALGVVTEVIGGPVNTGRQYVQLTPGA